MLARDQFDGSKEPFEGDRTLMVRSLPEGAQVTRATITLEPVAPPNRALFEEQILFSNGVSDSWGATKVKQAGATGTAVPPGFVEVDFHARRTLGSLIGTNLVGSALQVDLGGIYVPITSIGTIQTPTDTSHYQIDAGGLLPSLATSKFKLTLLAASPDISQVTVRSTPSNITLRLGQQPSFFARPGELAQKESCPDFSQILQTFFADAQVKDGFYEIPLTVHSDTIARLTVTMEVEYVQEQNPLPGGLQQTTLTFDHSSAAQAGSATLQVNVPAGARVIPGRTTARVRGSFQNSRIVYGPTGDLQPAAWILVNPSRAQATPLIFPVDLAASTVDLLLAAKSRTAQLALNVVKDVDGKPWTESILPEPAKLAIDSEIAGRPTWVNVPLPVEVQFKAGVRYWLVLQSLQGEAAWHVSPRDAVARAASNGIWTAGAGVAADVANSGPIGVQYTDTGGLAWRQEVVLEALGPLAAFVHLRQPAAVFQVPIALQVGEGEAARRVSLDRFQPLGRVDFFLDFDEVAEAINQVVSSARAAPPEGEHLRNHEFEDWRRVGDTPREPLLQVSVGQGSVLALAASPDGEFLYIVTLTESDQNDPFKLAILDTACQELEEVEISLGLENFYGMAVSPDGRRAYILQDDLMSWVDLETRSILGKSSDLGDLFGASGQPVFSPDGGHLYVRYSDQILIFDTAILEKEFSGEKKLERAVVGNIKIDSAWQPVALAISPDNTRLYILVTGFSINNTETGATGPFGEIWIYMLDSKAWGTPIQLGKGDQYNMALNPDGSRIIVTNVSSQEVSVFETRRGQPLGLISTENTGSPSLIAVDPGGKLVFVAIDEVTTVAGFDLSRLQLGLLSPKFSFNELPSDLEILPSGEWLYIADNSLTEDEETGLSVVALGAMIPAEWTLTSGEIFPQCISESSHRIAVFGLNVNEFRFNRKTPIEKPTAISQVVPVVGGIHYILSFTGAATTSDAQVEVFWYGEQCSFQKADRMPFETIDIQELDSLENLLLPTSRLEMTSPLDVSLAEVRISVPERQAAFLDNVSFQATADALSNSDLQAQSNGRVSGWELIPAGATGVTVVASSGLVTLRNGGSTTCSLQQIVPFQAEKTFNLVFSGHGLGGDPLIRLEWLGADGSNLGTPLEIQVTANGSDREERRGSSPAGTQHFLLSLVLPPGAGLNLGRISLDTVEVTSVPISFIAQAPGELIISDVSVVYEIVKLSPPGVPAYGLCPPTPPGGQPGSGSQRHYHCPSCGEDDELCDPEPSMTPAGTPALEGECCHCGAHLTLPGGQPQAQTVTERPQSTEMHDYPFIIRRTAEAMQPSTRRVMSAKTLVAPSTASPEALQRATTRTEISGIAAEPRQSPMANMSAAIVSGVGERFSKTLKRLRRPVMTIADLAALDIEIEIKTIPRERRLELKTSAEMILAIDLHLEPFGDLGQESLEVLLTSPPETLADQAGSSMVLVEQLQRGLRALRLLIKNDEFRNLHLEDLAARQD